MPGGIYLDEGSGHIEVTGNVVYNVQRPLNFNNHAQNRFATCVVRDNFECRPENTGSAADIVANAGPRPED